MLSRGQNNNNIYKGPLVSSDNMARVRKAKIDVKKKKWVTIVAPKFLQEQPLGETYIVDKKVALGKKITVNLMTILKDMKKQGISVTFAITGQKEEKVETEIIGFKFLNSAVKRMIRRNRNKIDDSFLAETRDGKKLRIKPLITTRSRTVKSVQSKIRKSIKVYLLEEIKKITKDQFMSALIFHKFQRSMYERLKKIYPIASCEVRWVIVLEKERYGASKPAPVEEKPVEKEVKKESAPVKEEAPKEEAAPVKEEAPKEEAAPVKEEAPKEEATPPAPAAEEEKPAESAAQ